VANGDRVGLVAFSDRVEEFVPPGKTRKHVLRIIRELLYLRPQGKRTSIAAALSYLAGVSRRRAIVFLLSDFHDTGYEAQLRAAALRHDVIALTLGDRRERELPDVGLLDVQDAETGERMTLDTTDARVRAAFARRADERSARRRRALAAAGVDEGALETGASYVEPLLRLFRSRERGRVPLAGRTL
jgi:uncharacterized protein (DUF58 family)